jgi:hypothetical protein
MLWLWIAQCRFQLACGVGSDLVDDLADAAIEALHHAIGLRVARWSNEVFNPVTNGCKVMQSSD